MFLCYPLDKNCRKQSEFSGRSLDHQCEVQCNSLSKGILPFILKRLKLSSNIALQVAYDNMKQVLTGVELLLPACFPQVFSYFCGEINPFLESYLISKRFAGASHTLHPCLGSPPSEIQCEILSTWVEVLSCMAEAFNGSLAATLQ